ncbi:MAG: tRNA 2-thiouridine(34) synthase MnmA [Parcubacteria group bacterium]|nr:tRNA 2-thiouridine(34) synthase MnmA [Parcubacteria group bacterium]
MIDKKKETVFCAMSGGVDSSVAAALLQEAGFDVVGVFMYNWHQAEMLTCRNIEMSRCPWEEDQESARQAAAKIGIPFYTWDFSEEYKNRVVNYMVSGYAAGETPNPDVMCNKEIKFGLFLEKAKRMGADYIATGHYVRKKIEHRKWRMDAAVDGNKDQSYFLWTLTQAQLRYCLFPIGEYTKPEVRKMARELGLPNAERKDSQGLCFVGRIRLGDFLGNYIQPKVGPIKLAVSSGEYKKIGEHPGVQFYTIGQRHGIGIGGGTPYFVVAKDAESNVLTVALANEDRPLWQKKLVVADVNWITGLPPAGGLPLRCLGRIRYRQPLQKCIVKGVQTERFEQAKRLGVLDVTFDEPQRAVAPGQSVVFYAMEKDPSARGASGRRSPQAGELRMLGGGVIIRIK